LSYRDVTVSASSVTGILGLDLSHGSVVRIIAEGFDAEDAAQAIKDAISSGLGEEKGARVTPEAAKWEPDQAASIGGIPASPGLACGTLVVRSFELPPFDKHAANPDNEQARLHAALERVSAELTEQAARYLSSGEQDKAQIFTAHAEILSDQYILLEAKTHIQSGASAPQAWRTALEAQIEKIGSLKSPVLRQRASDMKDVARRVLFATLDLPAPQMNLS